MTFSITSGIYTYPVKMTMIEQDDHSILKILNDWKEAIEEFKIVESWQSEWINCKGVWNAKTIEAFRWVNSGKDLEIRFADGEIATLENAYNQTLPEYMNNDIKSFEITTTFNYDF